MVLINILIIIAVTVQKLINYFIIYVSLFGLKAAIHPYDFPENSFVSSIVSSNAVLSLLSFCLIGIIVASLFIAITITAYKFKILKISRKIAFMLLLITGVEIVLLLSGFSKLRAIAKLVENCEHEVQVGCYFYPAEIEQYY